MVIQIRGWFVALTKINELAIEIIEESTYFFSTSIHIAVTITSCSPQAFVYYLQFYVCLGPNSPLDEK